MSIPIQNLYYLLTYAWDRRLRHLQLTELEASACPDLNQLLSRVLVRGVRELVGRGIDRAYREHEELTPRLKGRIDFSRSARRQTWREGRMHCSYDELSCDMLPNRILKATMRRLACDPALTGPVHRELLELLEFFGEIPAEPLHISSFRRLQFHRNNRIYRLLMEACSLIFRSCLPDRSAVGKHRFRDITADDKAMASIFEKFVRGFAARHLARALVGGMTMKWNAVSDSAETMDLLPQMKTDVTIEWPERKLSLDCKFYGEALKGQYDRNRFISSNLYQLHAYLVNKAVQGGGWERVEGMLLYPTNGTRLDHRFTLHGTHPVRIVTLDLNQPWKSIEGDLISILTA